MKKLLFLIVAVLTVFSTHAEDVYISVALPKDCTFDNNTNSLLKNKLLNIVSSGGVASTECCAIILVPEVNLLNKEQVESGMRNITTLEILVTITVRNILTDAVYNTMSITMRGNGYSEIEAVRSAIRNLEPDKCSDFIKISKEKILEYYRDNTSVLITKANMFAKQQLYDEAIATLASYPESLAGYPQIANIIIEIFRMAQTKYCKEIMQTAMAAYSQLDFENAAELASSIDVTSSCASEAKKLLEEIKQSIDKQYNYQIETERQQRMSKERIATLTINAARDVAVEYYKSQNNYIFIP